MEILQRGIYDELLAPIAKLLAGPPIWELYEVSLEVEIAADGALRMHGIRL